MSEEVADTWDNWWESKEQTRLKHLNALVQLAEDDRYLLVTAVTEQKGVVKVQLSARNSPTNGQKVVCVDAESLREDVGDPFVKRVIANFFNGKVNNNGTTFKVIGLAAAVNCVEAVKVRMNRGEKELLKPMMIPVDKYVRDKFPIAGVHVEGVCPLLAKVARAAQVLACAQDFVGADELAPLLRGLLECDDLFASIAELEAGAERAEAWLNAQQPDVELVHDTAEAEVFSKLGSMQARGTALRELLDAGVAGPEPDEGDGDGRAKRQKRSAPTATATAKRGQAGAKPKKAKSRGKSKSESSDESSGYSSHASSECEHEDPKGGKPKRGRSPTRRTTANSDSSSESSSESPAARKARRHRVKIADEASAAVGSGESRTKISLESVQPKGIAKLMAARILFSAETLRDVVLVEACPDPAEVEPEEVEALEHRYSLAVQRLAAEIGTAWMRRKPPLDTRELYRWREDAVHAAATRAVQPTRTAADRATARTEREGESATPQKGVSDRKVSCAVSGETAVKLARLSARLEKMWAKEPAGKAGGVRSVLVQLPREDKVELLRALASNGKVNATGSTDARTRSLPPAVHVLIQEAELEIARFLRRQIEDSDVTGLSSLSRREALMLAQLVLQGEFKLNSFISCVQNSAPRKLKRGSAAEMYEGWHLLESAAREALSMFGWSENIATLTVIASRMLAAEERAALPPDQMRSWFKRVAELLADQYIEFRQSRAGVPSIKVAVERLESAFQFERISARVHDRPQGQQQQQQPRQQAQKTKQGEKRQTQRPGRTRSPTPKRGSKTKKKARRKRSRSSSSSSSASSSSSSSSSSQRARTKGRRSRSRSRSPPRPRKFWAKKPYIANFKEVIDDFDIFFKGKGFCKENVLRVCRDPQCKLTHGKFPPNFDAFRKKHKIAADLP